MEEVYTVTVKPGFLFSLLALSLLLPASSTANPVRVEGLVGDPREGMTHLFLEDSTDVFLNPALAGIYRNRIDVNLGIGAGNGVTLEPMGGALLGNSKFTFGLYLNREEDRYTDQAALASAAKSIYDAGAPSTPRYLPIDLMLSFDLGGVALGIGAYAAFGRTRSYSEQFVIDDRDESVVTENTTGSHYISASIGVAADTRRMSPQGWFRFSSMTDWSDNLSYMWSTGPSGEPGEHFTDITQGLAGTVSISGGFRMPVKISKELSMTPAISVAVGRSSLFSNNRLANLASENDALIATAVALTAGTAINYRPTDSLLAVFSISADVLNNSVSFDNLENDEALATAKQSSTRLRLPVITIGAEADLLAHLRLRGCIRAGMAVGLNVGGEEQRDDDGLLSLANTNDTDADPMLSASFGLSFPFEPVDIDLTVGGDLISAEEGSFFSQAGVTIYLP